MTAQWRPKISDGFLLKFCQHRKTWLLMGPEKSVFLNQTAATILSLCSGQMDLASICEQVSDKFDAVDEQQLLQFIEKAKGANYIQ